MPRIVGLDIGTYSVKATVWKSSGRNFFFEAQYSQPVPQDEENLPSTVSQLSALDRMVDANEDLTHGGNVYAAAWGSDAASLHRVSLPFTEMAQIKKTLQFAVEDEVPFELDDMVLGWRVLSSWQYVKRSRCPCVGQNTVYSTSQCRAQSQLGQR